MGLRFSQPEGNRQYEKQESQNNVKDNTVEESKGEAQPPEPKLSEPKLSEPKFPDNYEAILQDANPPIDMSDKTKHYDLLCSGVFFDQKRKRYWIDKKTNNHSVMMLARALYIVWVDDQRYWKWTKEKIEPQSDVKVDVAELLRVCWLEVHGKMDTRKLSKGTLYEVALVVFLKTSACGWENPVTLKLLQPNGKKYEYKDNFNERKKGTWIEIPVGEFTASTDNEGELEVCMLGFDGGNWKSGLTIKGVLIRSKN